MKNDSKEKYQRYLASREWGLLKRAVRNRSKGICERCNANRMEAVHHLTYSRKYNELLEDLQAICKGCHDFVHGYSYYDPKAAAIVYEQLYGDKSEPKPNHNYDLSELYGIDIQNTPKKVELKKPKRTLRVYLAGKITGDSWRSEIAPDWTEENHGTGATENQGEWFIQQRAIPSPIDNNRFFDLTGPFWRPWGNCGGHCGFDRCATGLHANGEIYKHGGEWTVETSNLSEKIFRAIDDADIFFAWINSLDCYGTLVEIGYAKAKNKDIIIGTPKGFDTSDIWLACSQSACFIQADTPLEVWKKWCCYELTRHIPYESLFNTSVIGGAYNNPCGWDDIEDYDHDRYVNDAPYDPDDEKSFDPDPTPIHDRIKFYEACCNKMKGSIIALP